MSVAGGMADAWNGAEPGAEPIDGERIKRELGLYIGPNADQYLKAFELTGKGGIAYRTSWHWPAALVPVPWLFYRKLYIPGTLLVFALVALALLFPNFPGVALGVFFGLVAKSFYLDIGLGKLKKADANGREGPEREAYLKKAGGVSIPGAVLGSAIMASAIALAVPAPEIVEPPRGEARQPPDEADPPMGEAELPGCDDPTIRTLAAELSARIATEAGLPGHILSVDAFKELRASDPETTRRCQMTAGAHGKSARVVFTILWEDEGRGEVQILMGRLKIQSLFE